MDLNDLGWQPALSQHFDALNISEVVPARVARQDRHRYLVLGEAGEMVAQISGKMRAAAHGRADFPTVGDWVAVSVRPEEGEGTIHALLPRRSAFSRKVAGDTTEEQIVAANVDTVFLISGLDGDFNLRRIERYVTLAWNSGATPVILLNKADVCEDVPHRIRAVEAVAMGIDIHALSATDGTGLDVLRPYLTAGHTVALLGSSGVGKSTLVNQLLGDERMKTGGVRDDDSRGRHTTTFKELILVPWGGVLIDTPGLREVQLWADEESLQSAFADVEVLADECRFRDCTHEGEPGCAVQEALNVGVLDQGRYQSYLKLKRELAYLARRQRDGGNYQERRRKKEEALLHKRMRNVNRSKR